MEDLKVLRVLDLSGNQISSLEGLEEHNLLEEINLEGNQVMSCTMSHFVMSAILPK